MPATVLILTEPSDVHAHAVALSLQQRGADALLWYTSDFPSVTGESVLFEGGRESTRLGGVGVDELATYDISRVWRRRPTYVLREDRLHRADRHFASSECKVFRQSLLGSLLPEAFWVNPSDAAAHASRKLVQQRTARATGLTTPDTLFSNDPNEIRDFLGRHGGEAVYKTLSAVTWRDTETAWIPYTSAVTEDRLVADDLLRSTPGIFQARVPKEYELRVTVVGRRCFSAKILSQQTTTGKLDWRKAYGELRMEPYALPRSIEEGCLRLMDRLGIVFGCFDFAVTPMAEYLFLEVNEMGQFLFVEYYTGLPLLDAFSEFLLQGSADFAWSAERMRLSYKEIEADALSLVRQAQAGHLAVPENPNVESRPRKRRV